MQEKLAQEGTQAKALTSKVDEQPKKREMKNDAKASLAQGDTAVKKK